MEKPTLTRQWILLILFYVIAYLYCLPFAIAISQKDKWKMLNDVHQGCVIGCHPIVKPFSEQPWRGENYFVGLGKSDCFLGFWGITHFTLYTCIGYSCPDLFWPSFGCGVAFELYEKYRYKCQDVLDIFLNTGGFFFGNRLRSGFALR